MPARALTAEDVAAQFGRSKPWIYNNWQRLVAENRLPQPLQEAGRLIWSAAQVYAYLDKDLPPKLRPLVAAHRAAEDAAASGGTHVSGDLQSARAALDRRFNTRKSA